MADWLTIGGADAVGDQGTKRMYAQGGSYDTPKTGLRGQIFICNVCHPSATLYRGRSCLPSADAGRAK
jgi:hypothetical protein